MLPHQTRGISTLSRVPTPGFEGPPFEWVAQNIVSVSALACSHDDGRARRALGDVLADPLSAPNADESPPPDKKEVVSCVASR